MKLLAKLERTTLFWWIIALCTFFFFLRLPSLIEPYWYGDEGIYEVVGIALDHGRLLYRDIWDNKPPLLYVTYALAQGDQPTVKFFSLIAGLLSLIVFFLLSQKLFKNKNISIATTFLFLLLLGTPLLEGNIANAEDFIILPILIAGLLIYKQTTQNIKSKILNTKYFFIAGFLLGIAFLFKTVAVFDFLAFLIFFTLLHAPEYFSFSFLSHKRAHRLELHITNYALWSFPAVRYSFLLILGFLIPFAVTVCYFALNHSLHTFFQSVFFDNVNYVGYENTFLGIPQGLLLLKCILLLIGLVTIFWKRKRLSPSFLFIFIWLIFSLFNIYFSGRPYTHYVIVLLPSFCLLTGLLFTKQSLKKHLTVLGSMIIVLVLILLQFRFDVGRSLQYYHNTLAFLMGRESIETYQSFFDPHVSRDYAIASFIKANTKPDQTVFVWGNNPEIYALSHKLPPGEYTVAYHVMQNNAFIQTQEVVTKVHPKYVIILKESQPLPFSLPLYIMRYNLAGATIYERSI